MYIFSKYKYFKLDNSKSRTNEQIRSSTTLNNFIDFRRAWICNRGIFVYIGKEKLEHCLCPPSYYGNHCQFQSQRVSLTMKFSKECFSNCFGIYAIVVILVDQNQIIHSYEQFTFLTNENCSMKYNLNLLYKSRPKNQTINYTIHIHAYDRYELTYYASWILPVKFLFLPVNRIAAHLKGYSGNTCEKQDTQVDFSFHHIKIPQSLSVYFVTVQSNNDPIITMLSKKIQ